MYVRTSIFGLCFAVCAASADAQARSACHAPEALERAVRAAPSARTWAALGGWYGERSDFTCAIPAFEAALRLEPNSAQMHYYLGLSLHSAGKPQEALAHLNRSIELDPNQFKPLLLLGVVLNETGRTAEAEEAWESGLRIEPDSVIALDWLAKARIAEGQFDAAIDLLKSAPRDENLTLDLALAYSRSGQFDRAADTLESALKMTPANPRLIEGLATVYVQSHRYQDAANLLKESLAARPGNAAIKLLYLQVLVLADDSAAARPIADQLLKEKPDSFDALYLSGILDNNAQQSEAAVAHLKAAEAINPNHYDVCYNLGVALARLQQNEAARVQFARAVTLDPSQAEAHFHLAQVLKALGESQEAQKEFKLFQERQQATVQLALAQSKSGQAAQALKEGKSTAAVALYREAAAAQPDNALTWYNLALALDAASDLPGEREALKRAIELQPSFAAAENQLGYVEARSGNAAAAEVHFRRALGTVPRFAEAANNLGTLMGEQGRDREAEIQFRSAVSANPRFTRAWINLAATLASESQFNAAREAVESALKIDPKDGDALQLRRMLAGAPDGTSPKSAAAHAPRQEQR